MGNQHCCNTDSNYDTRKRKPNDVFAVKPKTVDGLRTVAPRPALSVLKRELGRYLEGAEGT